MNRQKICIIGDGLAGLTAAAILSKQNVCIDLYSGTKNKNKNLDIRTTAISESNFQYIKSNLNLTKSSIFWPCKKISLFFEDNKKIINFLNFKNNNKNFMHIFQNKDLKKKLDIIVNSRKNIRLKKKNIESINSEDSSVILDKKKIFYDLIILSIGGLSKLYSEIEGNRSIKKNYEEVAITAMIKHKIKIKNASQFFLKEGPLAILPFQKDIFSTVWSVNSNYFKDNEKDLKKILTEKIRKLLKSKKIKKIDCIQSFPINLNLKTKYYKKNILILGDGLHTVHPVAGQGFNLVLRDIKKLVDLISKKLKLGLLIKDSFLLKDFYNSRKPENNLFGLGINFTNSFFKDQKYFFVIKKEILKNINKFEFVKKISQSIADKGITL
jgi:2-polyprenyl-6-methoxyphenol hydroxylase-like FAD-dependent oxidoreductase